jgi:hypothetical protein
LHCYCLPNFEVEPSIGVQEIEQPFRAASVEIWYVANEGMGPKVKLIIQRDDDSQAEYSQGPGYRRSVELGVDQIETACNNTNV